ncbi:MAG TPA: N-acetylmuramoyl-L-alanine amidase [Rhodospirillum rubrum]|nr:N-acetylmuramoyl-L-alanine amidase [Rhodospirillum rubrum]
MKRRRLLQSLLAGLALQPFLAASANVRIRQARAWNSSESWRLVLELDGPPRYRTFSLQAPERLILDLPDAQLLATLSELPLDGPVRAIRSGQLGGGGTRIVLDLRQAVRPRSFALEPQAGKGHRLVLDLYPQALAAPPEPMLALARPLPSTGRDILVVVDAGHGGKDPGAIGASGTYEKIVTLEMARQLKRALEATGRYKVVLTRESDTSVRLRERIAFGRHAGADLFVSIHADAMANPQVRGLSVYTLSETASDDEAAQLADRENKVDILLGMDLSQESPDVATILIDLAQRETKNKSVHFANTLVSALPGDVLKLEKTRRYAGFAVLKAPDVPSVLVEMGFLSNVSDEKLLRTAPYRAKLAAALVRSVDDFFAPQQQRAWKP